MTSKATWKERAKRKRRQVRILIDEVNRLEEELGEAETDLMLANAVVTSAEKLCNNACFSPKL